MRVALHRTHTTAQSDTPLFVGCGSASGGVRSRYGVMLYVSDINSRSATGAFHTCFCYVHIISTVGVSRSSNGHFEALLDPGGGFRS